MSTITLNPTVAEFGVYKEAGAIVIGARFQDGERIGSVIMQIEEEGSALAKDGFGMHVEIDGKGFYRGVRDFRYDDSRKCLYIDFDPAKCEGLNSLQIDIPPATSLEEDQLLQEFTRSYKNSLAMRK